MHVIKIIYSRFWIVFSSFLSFGWHFTFGGQLKLFFYLFLELLFLPSKHYPYLLVLQHLWNPIQPFVDSMVKEVSFVYSKFNSSYKARFVDSHH